MRYELSDDEWTTIKAMLLNKARGVPRLKLAANDLAFVQPRRVG